MVGPHLSNEQDPEQLYVSQLYVETIFSALTEAEMQTNHIFDISYN